MNTNLIESLKKLFENKSPDSGLNDVMLSVAVLLYDIMAVDEKLSSKELDRFSQILRNQFNMEHEWAMNLLHTVIDMEGDRREHAAIIRSHLERTGQSPLQLMEMLNSMIYVDGIDPREYPLFDEIKILMTR